MTLPLEPYTVIDLTRARSGPTCVRQLANMGAKVIQVEAKGDPQGDFARHGFDYQNLHRNKRSITLDLKHSKGVEILKQLVARAVVALRFTSRIRRHSATSTSSVRARRTSPALLTRRCRRPNRSVTLVAIAATSASSRTSARTTHAEPPAPVISDTTPSAASR